MGGKILFPTDFSEPSEMALDCARNLKSAGFDEIILLHVIDVPLRVSAGMIENFRKHNGMILEEEKSHLEKEGWRAKVKIEIGSTYEKINEVAEEEDVDLIIIGARGESWAREAFLGSTTSNVIRTTKKPVLIGKVEFIERVDKIVCRSLCERAFRKVLFPTDFSRHSEKAFDFLKKMRPAGVESVILVHVVETGKNAAETMENRKKAIESLKVIEEELKRLGIECASHVHIGIPSKEILKIAEREDVSMIIMGTRGRGKIASLLLGSTAEAVAREARKPVLVVP